MSSGSAAHAMVNAEEPAVELGFAGQRFLPLPSGALYWPAERTLLVADLHLEKFSSYARHGRLLPPYDTAATLRRLEADLLATGAEEVIALGDSFHRDEGVATLLDADRLRLMALLGRARWTWLSGNHDPAPHALGGLCRPDLERHGIRFVHEPQMTGGVHVAGHLHPAALVAANGRAVRRPCFVNDGRLLILPAYGSGTGALNILSPAFAGLFDWTRLAVTMIGRHRVYPVSVNRLVAGV